LRIWTPVIWLFADELRDHDSLALRFPKGLQVLAGHELQGVAKALLEDRLAFGEPGGLDDREHLVEQELVGVDVLADLGWRHPGRLGNVFDADASARPQHQAHLIRLGRRTPRRLAADVIVRHEELNQALSGVRRQAQDRDGAPLVAVRPGGEDRDRGVSAVALDDPTVVSNDERVVHALLPADLLLQMFVARLGLHDLVELLRRGGLLGRAVEELEADARVIRVQPEVVDRDRPRRSRALECQRP
jgi:hypothetical protein